MLTKSLQADKLMDRETPFALDAIQLLACVMLSVFSVYFAPQPVSYFFFLIVFVLILISPREYFWIAFFLLLYSTPLGLFSESTREAVHRLPLFSAGKGFSLSTFDVFLILFFLKALFKKREYQFAFRKPWELLLVFSVILLIISFVVHRTSISILFGHLRSTFIFSLLFSLPMLIKDKEEYFRLLRLVRPYVIVVLIGAIYFFTSGGEYLFYYFNPDYDIIKMELGVDDVSFSQRFALHGGQFYLVFLIFVFSLISYALTRKSIDLIFSLLCFLVIIFGGFRSWFVIFSLIYIVFFLASGNKSQLVLYGIGAFFAMLVLVNTNLVGSGLSSSWSRVETIFTLGSEGSDATRSLEYKQKMRLGKQLRLIAMSPVFGWGFSEEFIDPDVGNFGMLAEVGFVGFFFYLYLWFYFIGRILRASKTQGIEPAEKFVLKILLVSFVGLLISHFTTNQIFGFKAMSLLVCFFFVMAHFIIYDLEKPAGSEESASQPVISGSTPYLIK